MERGGRIGVLESKGVRRCVGVGQDGRCDAGGLCDAGGRGAGPTLDR